MKSHIVFGLIVIIGGILTILDPIIYGHPVPKGIGAILILLGLFYAAYTLIAYTILKKNEAKPEYAKYVKCVKCKGTFFKEDIVKDKCPKCGGELENLSGFYDRHPELKD